MDVSQGNYSNLYATSNPCAQSQTYTSDFSRAATSERREKEKEKKKLFNHMSRFVFLEGDSGLYVASWLIARKREI